MPALANASEALSQLSGLDFVLEESDVVTMRLAEVQALWGQRYLPDKVYGIYLGTRGLFFAHILLLFAESNAQRLVSAMVGEPMPVPLDELGESALGEVGNVVGTAFLNVFADVFHVVWEPTIPSVVYGDLNWVAERIPDRTPLLVTEARFHVVEQNIRGHIVVMPLNGEG